MEFGIREFDDESGLSRMIKFVAPMLQKKYVVMEVRKNLLANERKTLLEYFPGFKKTALIVMGEPPKEYKAKIQSIILEEKKAKVVQQAKRDKENADWKKAEEKKNAEWAKAQE